MGSRKKLEYLILIFPVFFFFFVAGGSLLNNYTCHVKDEEFNSFLNMMGDVPRTKYIDFALSDEEGFFRQGCHKAKILRYVKQRIDQNQPIRFNRYNLKYYIGDHMSSKSEEMIYEDGIDVLASNVARKTFDDNLVRDIKDFYKKDRDSLREVRFALKNQ